MFNISQPLHTNGRCTYLVSLVGPSYTTGLDAHLECYVLVSLAQDPEWFSCELREGRESKHGDSEAVTWNGGLLQEGAQPEEGE